jgi:hypothetical protein
MKTKMIFLTTKATTVFPTLALVMETTGETPPSILRLAITWRLPWAKRSGFTNLKAQVGQDDRPSRAQNQAQMTHLTRLASPLFKGLL